MSIEHIQARLQKNARTATGDCWLHGAFEARVFFDNEPQCQQCAAIEEGRIAAEREAEQRGMVREIQLDAANLRGRFRDVTFDNYKADTPEQRAALATCKEFVANFDPNKSGNLWLIGTPGTGKTHLGAAAAIEVRLQHKQASRLMTCREVVRAIRATWQKDAERTEEQVIDALGNLPLLVLDEVGVGFGSESELVNLYDVLDMRYQLRRPTVLISNLDASAIKAFLGDRLYDRLREGAKVLPCKWASYRKSAVQQVAAGGA